MLETSEVQILKLSEEENLFYSMSFFFFLKSKYQRLTQRVYFWSSLRRLLSYDCQPVAAGTTTSDTYKVEHVFVSFKWLSVGFISLIRSNCDWDWQVICQKWMFHKEVQISWSCHSNLSLFILENFSNPSCFSVRFFISFISLFQLHMLRSGSNSTPQRNSQKWVK